MSEEEFDMGRYKLFYAIVITVTLMVALPHILEYLGWIGGMKEKSWFILLIVGTGIVIKYLVNDTANGEFLFHKSGYDNCLITFAAMLTALSLQVTSQTDLFPGLAEFTPLAIIPSRIGQIAFLLLLSLAASMVTARTIRSIEDGSTLERGIRSLTSTIIGLIMFSIYILMLVSRG
jgi:hypothetical protein